LLGHGERPGKGDPDRAAGVRAEELDVAHLDRPLPPDRPDDARNRVLVARAVDRDAGVVEVDPVERGREAVRVALAPYLAVADHVDAGLLHVPDREKRRVVLRLLEEALVDAPELSRAHARRKAAAETL